MAEPTLNQLRAIIPQYSADKFIAKYSFNVTLSGAAYNEGIHYEPHGLDEAQLPIMYYQDPAEGLWVEANYGTSGVAGTYGDAVLHCAMSSTNIVIPWVNVAGGTFTVPVEVWVMDKWQK